MRPYRSVAVALALLFLSATLLSAHDMFFRLRTYFVAPATAMKIPLLNGTFSSSANSIAWARVRDLSVNGPAGRQKKDSASWDTHGDTSFLAFTPNAPGTYVVGLSTAPNELDMTAEEFNKYLADDGIPDILALRKSNGSLGQKARERYHKHVKAIFQVGDTRTNAWQQELGYPAELVPTTNPYDAKRGTVLAFRCLVGGKPVANQLVMIGGRRPDESRLPMLSTRCDAQGVVHVTLNAAGIWYVKFVHMAPVTDGPVNYESTWASVTFAVR
jgi:hypothetical protein